MQAEGGTSATADTAPRHERHSVVTQLFQPKKVFTEESC